MYYLSQIIILTCVKIHLIMSNENVGETIYKTIPSNSVQMNLSNRLPNTTIPVHYYIHVTTFLHRNDITYKANTTIDIYVMETTREIILHGINFDQLKITAYNLMTNTFIYDINNVWNQRYNFLILQLTQPNEYFHVGLKYRLQFLYEGIMNENAQGLFWLLYENQKNGKTYVAATHFEPTGARLLFPCYDEPSFKANFTISLTHNNNYNSISNMPIHYIEKHAITTERNSTLITTHFHTTPLMSTYLVAFVICNFDHITKEFHGVTQSIYTPSIQNKNQGQKHLQAASEVLAALENFLDVNYPLKKLDHVILNKNYGLAMENWGLIIYKEKYLIHDDNEENPTKTNWIQEQKSLIVLAHEITHQWFGNLVTPQWWSFAWLKEGFATYLSYIIIDMLHPTYKIMDLFLIEIKIFTHKWNDYDVQPQPITHYVKVNEEITSVFDTTSYRKAACIIRMFHNAFGNDIFSRGVKQFLLKFQYSIVNETDLFECFQNAATDSIHLKQYNHKYNNWLQTVMSKWSHNKWIPIVMITRNYEDNTIKISQQIKNQHNMEESFLWIPLNFATSSYNNFSQTEADYFMPPIQEVILNISEMNVPLKHNDWLIANKQITGLYHIIYDDENLFKIANALQQNLYNIHEFNRMDIFDGLQLKLNQNNLKSIIVVFELLKYLKNEQSLLVWNSAVNIIHHLNEILYDSTLVKPYKDFIRHLIKPIFRVIRNESQLITNRTIAEQMISHHILTTACQVDLSECLEYTHRLTYNYIYDISTNNIQYNNSKVYNESNYDSMQMAIFCSGLRYLNDDQFDILIEFKSKADDLLDNLHCLQKQHHIKRYLNLLIDGEHFINNTHNNDIIRYIQYVYKRNYAARSTIWQMINENYTVLLRVPVFIDMFNNLAEYINSNQFDQFCSLLEKIKTEMVSNKISMPEYSVISCNSSRIGLKVKSNELLLHEYNRTIETWLLHNQFHNYINRTKIWTPKQYNCGRFKCVSEIIKIIFVIYLLLH